MEFMQYYRQPNLRSPVVIAAFAGWNDAADSATTAIKFLIDRWHPIRLAEIDSEEFFVFTETRPNIRIVAGRRTVSWPTNQFLFHQAPSLDRDIILYLGVEPQLKWRMFSEGFIEVCKRFNTSEVLLLGALLADVPHSIEVPISGFASQINLADRLDGLAVRSSPYEGPTGIVGVLYEACQRANIPAASLWAAASHYLAATPNIKVTAALLTYLNTFFSFDLDLKSIQVDAVRFEEQISTLVARDAEASAYVEKLEQQVAGLIADEDEEEDTGDSIFNPDRVASTGPLPSADVLIRGVEELLRKERKDELENPDDEKGNS